ncbi:MAG: thioredoxin family protein [Gammaproteobacteria bacterium]|nr:thioredoxin family protein [Gammaproteobacteria bacterium]|tara:strand:- start:1305 stop:1571 length:267 start_codon:yes stop_codon:yes gene_type:complete
MAQTLLLYTTAGCHLCEQAEEVLNTVLAGNPALHWTPVEISDDPALVEAYGLRIPVIRLQGRQSDLGWPFDEATVSDYLARMPSPPQA